MTKYRVIEEYGSFMPMKKEWYWPFWKHYRYDTGYVMRFNEDTLAIAFCREKMKEDDTRTKVVWESHPHQPSDGIM